MDDLQEIQRRNDDNDRGLGLTPIFQTRAAASAPDTQAIVIKNILKTGHGFTAGKTLYVNGSVWAKARADLVQTSGYVGMVSRVIDTDHFDLTLIGIVTGLSGLVMGRVYYLSDVSAGDGIAKTALGTDAARIPIFIAVSTTSCYFFGTSQISMDLDRLVLGDADTGGGKLQINFAPDQYLKLDTDGSLTLFFDADHQLSVSADLDVEIRYPDSCVVAIAEIDFAGYPGAYIKPRVMTVCDPGTGASGTALVMMSQTF